MQQAVKVLYRSAYMYLGELIVSESRTRNHREIYSDKFEECLLEEGYTNILGIGVNVQINLD
jgi:hypothetical protein